MVVNWGQNTLLTEPHGAARAASRVRAGGYRRQWARQGAWPPRSVLSALTPALTGGAEPPELRGSSKWETLSLWGLRSLGIERVIPNGAMEVVAQKEWGFESLPQSGQLEC